MGAVANMLVAMSLAALFPAAILYVANVFAVNRRMSLAAHGAAFVGWALLTAGLVARVAADGFPALSTGFQALGTIASALLFLHLLQIPWKDLPSLGAVVTPLSLAALFAATVLPGSGPGYQSEVLASQWIYLHVISIVLSMVLLMLAGAAAVLWLAQHHLLKRKKWTGTFRRLPPLELLDGIGFTLAAIGFAALTVGISTAVVWSVTHPDQAHLQGILLRLTAIISWLLYALYLWAHTQARWRGRRAQWILVVGCVAVLLTTCMHRWILSGAPPDAHTPGHPPAAGARGL